MIHIEHCLVMLSAVSLPILAVITIVVPPLGGLILLAWLILAIHARHTRRTRHAQALAERQRTWGF